MKTVVADLGHDSLKPLTYTRASTDLEVGGATVFEHIRRGLNTGDIDVLVPEYLEEITEINSEVYDLEREINPDTEGEYLLYNSTVIPDGNIREQIDDLELGEGLYYEDNFIGAITDELPEFDNLEETVKEFERKHVESEPIILEHSWDLVKHNGELIQQSFPGHEIKGAINEKADLKGESGLYLGTDAVLEENVIVDTTGGPVHIGSGTRVSPNSRIEGPTYIGSNTKVGAGQNAVIHENTHIGDVARAGGEFEDAILNSFSNKYHYGFLGHAVVGSWVNIGAGTTNSDLKSTYGTVKAQHPEEGLIEAGLKVGATLADHTKADIQTSIYAGKQIGPVARISGDVIENVEPFTWQNIEEEMDYIVDKAVEHAERMMDRRKDELPEGYIKTQKKLVRELAGN